MIENHYGHSRNCYGGDNCDDCDRYCGNCRGHAKVKAVIGMVGMLLTTHKDNMEGKSVN